MSAHKIHTPRNHPKERMRFLFSLLLKNRIKIYTVPSFNILICVLVKFGLPFRGRSTDSEHEKARRNYGKFCDEHFHVDELYLQSGVNQNLSLAKEKCEK
jgi:hypothetical protein